MGRYVSLREGKIETDFGVVHLQPGDVFTIEKVPEEYLIGGFVKPLKEALKEKYTEFKRILDELEVIREEIEAENPSFAKVLQDAINCVETFYVKEDYNNLTKAIKHLRSLYLQAVRGQF